MVTSLRPAFGLLAAASLILWADTLHAAERLVVAYMPNWVALETVMAKALCVVDDELGGVMIWSLDHDVKGESSLLSAIHQTLEGMSTVKQEVQP